MKLAYIYVEQHKVLKKIGVSFSNSHQITFEHRKLYLNGIESNLDYYNGIQCTAIVGKNGAGKSTLLDFIESSYETTDSSGFFVWFDEKKKIFHICLINYDIHSIEIESSNTVKVSSNYRRFINNHKIRLVKANNLSGMESSTISKRARKNVFSYDLSLAQYKTSSPTKLAQRISRLMNFFANSSWMKKEKNITVEFEFFFKSSSTTYLKNLLSRENVKEEFNLSNSELELLDHMLQPRPVFISESLADSRISLKAELIRANLLSLLRHATKYTGFRPRLQDFMFLKLLTGYLSGKFRLSNTEDVLELLNNNDLYEHSDFKEISQADAFIVLRKFHEVSNIIGEISQILVNYHAGISVKDKDRITSHQATFIINLMMLISKLPNNVASNFHYGWKGFSTGEFAKINLYAELFYYIKDLKRTNQENHLIVMDEVDLYLHPDWQREFLDDTLNFLKAEYPSDSIQLIITSHSPIIIGDFLPEDIISLYREPTKSPQLGESFGFGTQILQLYMDGMYLSSTFGSHSKSHIDRIMDNKIAKSQTAFDKKLISKIKNSNIRRMLGDNE